MMTVSNGKFKVGDFVEVLRDCADYYHAGDIGVIIEVDDFWNRINFNGFGNDITDDGIWGAYDDTLRKLEVSVYTAAKYLSADLFKALVLRISGPERPFLHVERPQGPIEPPASAVQDSPAPTLARRARRGSESLVPAGAHSGSESFLGHSGIHDGLQNHSVGGIYPYAVVTYGLDPARHVVENLKTGCVACNKAGQVLQWDTYEGASDYLRIAGKQVSAVNWVYGRPRYSIYLDRLVIPADAPKDVGNKEGYVPTTAAAIALAHATKLESGRIGRPLTPYETYQVACDLENI